MAVDGRARIRVMAVSRLNSDVVEASEEEEEQEGAKGHTKNDGESSEPAAKQVAAANEINYVQDGGRDQDG